MQIRAGRDHVCDLIALIALCSTALDGFIPMYPTGLPGGYHGPGGVDVKSLGDRPQDPRSSDGENDERDAKLSAQSLI